MRTRFAKTIAHYGILVTFFGFAVTASAQQVIRLYSGTAPGSENWTQKEKEKYSDVFKTEIVTNVTAPTLTAYLPAKEKSTGTAVIICPGGGFRFLSINSEGTEVAKWLNERGVAAFVLKYRLVKTSDDFDKGLMAGISDRKKFDEENAAVVPLAVADGLAAVTYVRKHANEFNLSPSRIGLMGFSAGGTVTASVAFSYMAESRPDFIAPIYPYLGAVKETAVPKDAPPLFVAAATDDQLGLAPDSVTLYSKWLAAKKPAEIHIYAKGGHGFGMRKLNLPTDHWIERFGDWLQVQGLLKSQP